MKKWSIPVLLALLVLLASPVLAAEEYITVTDGHGQQGEVIFLTVSVEEAVEADAVGISFAYDSQYLECLTGECSWSKDGVLEDFGMRRNSGAWASEEAQNLQGELCVLAFRIRENVYFEETAIVCQVTMRKAGQTVGEWTAESCVTMVCAHAYGQWRDDGAFGHSRECTFCGIRQTQPHSWDKGVITDHPTDLQLELQTFTCTQCGGQMTKELPKDNGPTVPELTAPTQPRPTLPSRPDSPVVTLPGGQAHPQATLPQGEHDHEGDHTHADGTVHEAPGNESPQGLVILLALIAAMVGFALWFVRKKK